MSLHLSRQVGRRIGDMLQGKKMVLIGGGKMCEAMLGGLTKEGTMLPASLSVVDPHASRREVFSRMGIDTLPALDGSVHDADIVVFAVKPVNAPPLLEQLRGKLRDESLVMSIMAGIGMEDLSHLGTKHVVRTMPNTPALVNQGMTVWYPSCSVAESGYLRDMTVSILQSFGVELQVSEENLIDCATALSGTGPAYFFMLMEAMADAGVHMGFSREASLKIVQQTSLGAAVLAMKQDKTSPTGNRRIITSPAGTTAAAVYALDHGNFRTCIADAVWSAYRRALELGKKNSNVGPGRHI